MNTIMHDLHYCIPTEQQLHHLHTLVRWIGISTSSAIWWNAFFEIEASSAG